MKLVEASCWTVVVLCAGYLLFTDVRAEETRKRADRLEHPAQPSAPRKQGDVMGKLEIPGLGLSVAILEGDDAATLLRGAGHIRGTALPGGLGNIGLAGHRDTFFRPLRGIAPGMEIRLSGETGSYRYVVDSSEIVMPEAVDVLSIGSKPELTLITCYPFDFIGAAPKRFIVHSHLGSAAPEASTNPRSTPLSAATYSNIHL